MIRKYLFFVQNDKIAVLYTHGREISFLSKDGDIFYDIKEDFWTWWKDNIDFMDEEARDFVFVWNNKNEVIFNSPYFCEQRIKSAWDKDTLMRILSYFQDKNLLNHAIKVQSDDGKSIGDIHSNEIYLTNMKFETPVQVGEEARQQPKIIIGLESPMQQRLREELEREEAERYRYR